MCLYKLHHYILRALVILGLAQFLLNAQENDIRFRHLSIQDGLSQNGPAAIIQDRRGFIWIGTQDGLDRYDGYQFVSFKAEDNTVVLILAMIEDTNGFLWIGSEATKGLKIFNPSQGRFITYPYNPADSGIMSNKRVSVLCKDSSNNIWIGTDNGLIKFDKAKNRFLSYRADPGNPRSLSNNQIQALCQGRSGIIWAGTKDGGLNAFDPVKEQFTRYIYIPGDSTGLSNNTIRSICRDASGILWIGTGGGGLNRFDPETKKFSRYVNNPDDPHSLSDNYINAVYEDKSGKLWIGTENKGLCILDRRTNTFLRYQNNPENPASLSNNRVLSIFEDITGNLWFGTRGGGINLYIKEAQKFIHYKPDRSDPASLSYKMIWEIYEDSKGILWIGTDGGGLNRFDRKLNKFTVYKHDPRNPNSLSDNSIYNVFEDKKGMLWIGTRAGGLVSYNPTKETFVSYRFDPDDPTSISCDWVMCILEDRRGDFWIGTNGGGINTFDRTTGKFIRYPYDPKDSANIWGNKIRFIVESRSGAIWIGTLGAGLNEFDSVTKTVRHYTFDKNNTQSISSDILTSLCEDHSGTIWIGTFNGFNRMDMQKKTFTRFTKENGLPDNTIYEILEDNAGCLWMSSNRGLSKFNPRTGEVKNYDEKDGLQSNEFNRGAAFRSSTGEFYFGGINGFNRFFPDSIRSNTTVPRIVITDFRIFNKSVPIGKRKDGRTILEKSIYETDRIVLSHNDNVFSFEFAALHFVSPEKNQYAYMMEGFEKEWNYAGHRRFVTYTNLDPGTYTFRVKASNNDGLWNEEGTSLKITIVPPFWNTWWFYILLYLTVIVAAAAGYIIQINRLRRKKEIEDQFKAITDVNQVVEQGTAVAYRRKLNSNEYEFMGEGIRNITGYSAQEITVDLWNKIILKKELGGDLSPLTLKEVFDRVRKGTLDRWVADYKITTKSGEIRWVRDMITVLRAKSGQSDTLLGILFDITDRKQAEQKLALTSEELRDKNKEMEEDLNMAREIQTSFLSKYLSCFPPGTSRENCSVEFFHVYLPALKLAGDFFDVIPISDHEVGVLICDVIGHGARASLLAFYLRGLIAELMPVAHDPGSFMSKLNTGLNAIATQFSASVFATAFYLVADIKSGELRYTTAGHPMPFILRRSLGIVETLPGNDAISGSAIGLKKDNAYAESSTSFSPDDLVFFYTDGVYEVWNTDGQMFGLERLRDSLQNNLSIPDNDLLDKVINEILQFTTSNVLNDDICLVGMHVRKRK